MLRVVPAKEIELNFRSERQAGCSDLSALQNPMDMLRKPGVLGLIKVGIVDRHGFLSRRRSISSKPSEISPNPIFVLAQHSTKLVIGQPQHGSSLSLAVPGLLKSLLQQTNLEVLHRMLKSGLTGIRRF
jgi:hypothetical protein